MIITRDPDGLAMALYFLLGTAVLLIGGLGVFGGMFSSIAFAAAALVLVVLPAATALVLLSSRSGRSPFFMFVSCFTVICFVCSLFIRDLRVGAPPTAFIHERAGWIALIVSVVQLSVSVWMIVLGRNRNTTV